MKKALVLRQVTKRGRGDVDIICPDGGATCIHHNGEHWVSDYYQTRIDPAQEDIWEWLANNSKIYHKDWNNQLKDDYIDTAMIEDALAWHGHPVDMELAIQTYAKPEESDQDIIKGWLS